MSILTIYFSSNFYSVGKTEDNYENLDPEGFISERKRGYELVSEMAKNVGAGHMQRRTKEAFIMEGPGSGYILDDQIYTNKTGKLKWSEAQFYEEWENNIKLALDIIKSNKNSNPTRESRDYYGLCTAGYSHNWITKRYTEANLVAIPEPITKYELPTQVNLVGWSRGGVSCHMLANAMLYDNELSSVPVNILAIDPVAGTNDLKDNQTKLGSNVKEYVGLYARDERSTNFACIIPDTAKDTQVHIYPIAGRHTTLIGNRAADGGNGPEKFSEPVELTLYIAAHCLHRWKSISSPAPLYKNGIYKYRSYSYKNLNNSDSASEVLQKLKEDYYDYFIMCNTTYSTSTDIKGKREVYLDGQYTHFTAAQGDRFTPALGLAKGHTLEIAYYKDIV